MSTEKQCYYIKRTLQKDGMWFWLNEVYSGSALKEAGFSIDSLLNDFKIKVAKSPSLEEVASPDYYVYPQGEYEEDLKAAKRLLNEENSIETPWFELGFIGGYIKQSVKSRILEKQKGKTLNLEDFDYTDKMYIEDLEIVKTLLSEDRVLEWKIDAARRMFDDYISDDKVAFYLNISQDALTKIKKINSRR